MRYFKKELPKTPIFLPNGDKIEFAAAPNSLWGYYSTDREDYITHLVTLEQQGRGGVFAISQEEFDRDKKKEGLTLSGKPWREELGGTVAMDTLLPRQSPVAVKSPEVKAPAPAEPEAEKKVARPPNVGKRPL